MKSDLLRSHAKAVGVSRSVENALQSPELSSAVEDFLVERLDELPVEHLFSWLAHERVDGQSRPEARIVARIVETLSIETWFGVLHLPSAVRRVDDQYVRDAIIDGLRPRLAEDEWLTLGLLAWGGEVFNAVRDLEAQFFDGSAVSAPARGENGKIPLLFPVLFHDRRDDAGCCAAVVRALRDGHSPSYIFWLLQEAKLVHHFDDPSALLGDPPALSEIESADFRPIVDAIRLGHRWPNAEGRRRWFVARSLGAASRGVSWAYLWWEIPGDLRDEVALASVETTRPAPWAVAALTRRGSLVERWKNSAKWLEQHGTSRVDLNDGLWAAQAILGREPTKEEVEQLRDFDPESALARILDLPLPDDADEEFDETLERLERRWMGSVDHAVCRLMQLKRTPSRDRRIINRALEEGSIWMMPDVAAIAEDVGVLEREVPIPNVFRPSSIRTFRALAGGEANHRLGVALDTLIDGKDIISVIALADVAREVVDESRRTKLKSLVCSTPISMIAALHKSHPWLVSEADVLAEAARETRTDWDLVLSPPLPAYLAGLAEERSITTKRPDFATELLDSLEASGRLRREVLGIALKRLLHHDAEAFDLRWLGRKLDSGALWDDPGTEIVAALLRKADLPSANRVLQVCIEAWLGAPKPSVTSGMHLAIGRRLVAIAVESLDDGRPEAAENALRGLAHLSPSSLLRSRVRALRHLKGSEAVTELISLNETLLRRSDKHDVASFDAVREALSVLVAGVR